MLNTDHANVYTDFNGLAALKKEAKAKTPESIQEVAKQFESVFVNMMLKSMRQAKLAESVLDSKQTEFYQDMYDQQLAIHLSGEKGIGLAELIAKQLSPDNSVTSTRGQEIGEYPRQIINRPITKNKQPEAIINTKPVFNDTSFDSSDHFIQQLQPYAQQAAQALGVDANLLLSQAALETGWGRSVIKTTDGQSSYNLFNIKANSSWQGKQVKTLTKEFHHGVEHQERAGFRAYSSYQDSFTDYVNFIKSNPRYSDALKVAGNPKQYIQALQQAGYATDPHYADKVMRIYQSSQMTDANNLLVMQPTDNNLRR